MPLKQRGSTLNNNNKKIGPEWHSGKAYDSLSRSPGGSGRTGSCGFFRGSILGQDTSEPQPSTGETQERHE